jgi:long-chain acyl-CoA synthetase
VSLNAAIDRAGESSPFDIALVNIDGQTITWARLSATIRHFAQRLLSDGVRPGQYVMPLVDNPAVQFAMHHAALRIGALAVLAPQGAVERAGVEIDVAIALPDQTSSARRVLRFDHSWVVPATVPAGPDPVDPEPGILLASSGSTGLSKLMKYQTGGLAARAMVIAQLSPPPQTAFANFINPTTIAGFRAINRALLAGKSVILGGDPAETLTRMQAMQVRAVAAPGPVITQLCDVAETLGLALQLDQFETVGSLVSQKVQERVRRLFGCAMTVMYGSSEVGYVAAGQPLLHDPEEGLTGPVVPGVRLRFEPADGLDGETEGRISIWVLPEMRTTPYLNAEGPFDADGWFRTSDLGRLRADGHLVILGRADDVINPGGTGWHPAVIEGFSLSFPGIRHVAAFGVPTEAGHDALWIAVVAGADFSVEAYKAHVASRLGQTRLPVNLMILDDLPINAGGKVDRLMLRKLAREHP